MYRKNSLQRIAIFFVLISVLAVLGWLKERVLIKRKKTMKELKKQIKLYLSELLLGLSFDLMPEGENKKRLAEFITTNYR